MSYIRQAAGTDNVMELASAFGCVGLFLLLLFLTSTTGAGTVASASPISPNVYKRISIAVQQQRGHLTTDNSIRDIVTHPAFREFGNLLLPWEDNTRYYATRLREVGQLMPYHSHVNAGVVVEALNRMIDDVSAGQPIFYNMYTDEQKKIDPVKNATGLFFFRGKPGAPFAIVCPGGGFSYVGSLHEGFPLANEISKSGLNAFVIRYRLGEQPATEDLAAAISYIFSHAQALCVSTKGYSLWGGSAGARMVGNIALSGLAGYGSENLPKPGTVVITYTGQSSYAAQFPPTFITVSANDDIASVATVDRRVQNLKSVGVQVEYHRYQTAGHGFGLGVGTDAEGWIQHAIRFWETQLTG